MIEVIVATVGASLTAITCASLWLAGVIDKRERRGRALIDGDGESRRIMPFVKIAASTDGQGTPCPKCGVTCTQTAGPSMPKACTTPDKCPRAEHLHVSCDTCRARWLMAPAVSSAEAA